MLNLCDTTDVKILETSFKIIVKVSFVYLNVTDVIFFTKRDAFYSESRKPSVTINLHRRWPFVSVVDGSPDDSFSKLFVTHLVKFLGEGGSSVICHRSILVKKVVEVNAIL